MLTTDGHRGRTYDITGPELVTVGDLAAIASELTGRPVEHDDVDDAAMLDIFLAAGVDRPGDLVSFGRAIRRGLVCRAPRRRGGAHRAARAHDARAARGVARLTVAQNAVLRIGAGRTAGVRKRAARSRSSTTRQSASITMRELIFESPASRSRKRIGTSRTVAPERSER